MTYYYFQVCAPSHMHALMWRPLWENGQNVYQNPPTFEKLRLFPCWQNGTDALTSIRVADTESSKNVEYLLPRNHTERSNSLERRKYAKLCASRTHAQIKKFLPDVALSSDMNNYRNLYLRSHFLSVTSHCIRMTHYLP